MNPGKAGRVAENEQVWLYPVNAEGRWLAGKSRIQQDVGGWYVMPANHWRRVQLAILENYPGSKIQDPTEVYAVQEGTLRLLYDGASNPKDINVKGFICMPPETWEAVSSLLDKGESDNAEG